MDKELINSIRLLTEKVSEIKRKSIVDIDSDDNNLIFTNGKGHKLVLPKIQTTGKNGEDGVGISNIRNDEGTLLIDLTNGKTIDLGKINGENGEDGVGIKDINFIKNKLLIKLSNGQQIWSDEIELPKGKDGKNGENGENGKNGVGLENIKLIGENLIAKFDNGKTEIVGKIENLDKLNEQVENNLKQIKSYVESNLYDIKNSIPEKFDATTLIEEINKLSSDFETLKEQTKIPELSPLITKVSLIDNRLDKTNETTKVLSESLNDFKTLIVNKTNISNDIEKQIKVIKENYEKQIKTIKDNSEKQIKLLKENSSKNLKTIEDKVNKLTSDKDKKVIAFEQAKDDLLHKNTILLEKFESNINNKINDIITELSKIEVLKENVEIIKNIKPKVLKEDNTISQDLISNLEKKLNAKLNALNNRISVVSTRPTLDGVGGGFDGGNINKYLGFKTVNVQPVSNVVDIKTKMGNTFVVSMTSNATLTFSNWPSQTVAQRIVIYFKQDASGNRILTWPANLLWQNGAKVDLSTSANSIDVFVFETYDSGLTITANLVGKNYITAP